MKIWYDTEFIEDGRTIDLISIGMVREDGAELYLVNLDMPFGPISRHPWLMQNVMPSLPVHTGYHSPFDPDHPDYAAIKPRTSIAAEVRRFITDTTDPQLWAWYGAYDHVVLAQLFGRMIDLPTGIPMWTNDLQQEAARLGNPRRPGPATRCAPRRPSACGTSRCAAPSGRSVRTPGTGTRTRTAPGGATASRAAPASTRRAASSRRQDRREGIAVTVSVYEAAGMAGDGPTCGSCPRLLRVDELAERRVVCRPCGEEVLRLLGAVWALWQQLPSWVEKGTAPSGGGRGGGGAGGSAAPGNISAYSLLAGEVTDRLVVWEDDWRRTRGWGPAVLRGDQDERLSGVMRFLRDELPWAVCHDGEAVAGLLQDCRRLTGQMRNIVNPGPATHVRTQLTCPRPLSATTSTTEAEDTGDTEGGETVEVETCGGQLVFDKPRAEIRCRTCDTPVPRRRWLELGLTLGTITLQAA